MFGHKIKTPVLATVAACAMVLGLGTQSANAFGIEDAWNLNLSIANGVMHTGGGSFMGLADRANIGNANINGFGTISQQVVGGNAVGQPFMESGFLAITGTIDESAMFPINMPLGLGTAGNIYFQFDNLTGTLNGDGSISFDPNMGTIRLLLDSDLGTADPNDGGDTLELATFSIQAPSGGANKDFFGGAGDDSVIAITLIQTSELGLMPVQSALFTDMNDVGFNLNDPLTLHLGNVNALLVSIDGTGVDGMGNGVAEIVVQNGGQENIRTNPPTRVSEPSSMAALGFGLLGLMGMASRRRRKTA